MNFFYGLGFNKCIQVRARLTRVPATRSFFDIFRGMIKSSQVLIFLMETAVIIHLIFEGFVFRRPVQAIIFKLGGSVVIISH